MNARDTAIWSYRVGIEDPGDIGGYAICARDGEAGRVDKHDIDTGRGWLLVSTGPWIFGRTVMLPAGVIERIDHEERVVHVDRTKDQIRDAPEYDPDRPDDEASRSQVGDYHGAPGLG
jgi:hypothetical protein